MACSVKNCCVAPSYDVDEAQTAWETWRFNCGPGALTGVLGCTPEQIRPCMREFERKGYTNPRLMFAVLRGIGVAYKSLSEKNWPEFGLSRVQWTGPWTKPDVPKRKAYRHTHWVASRKCQHGNWYIFDFNCICAGGWVKKDIWEEQVVPWLLENCGEKKQGADGGWFLTHALEVATEDGFLASYAAMPRTSRRKVAQDKRRFSRKAL